MLLSQALDILGDSGAQPRSRGAALAVVARALYRLGRGRSEWDDAAQEVLARWCGPARLCRRARTEAQARAFLRRSLLFQMRSLARRTSREALVEVLPEVAVEPSVVSEEADRRVVLDEALARLEAGRVPGLLALRRPRDHGALLRGLRLRAAHWRALRAGRVPPVLSEADERASRRAAVALRAVYSPGSPAGVDPVEVCLGRLARLDLRQVG